MATRAEALRKTATTHGLSGTPTHAAWKGMRQRVSGKVLKDAKYYSHVTCCPRWELFENFLADMGEKAPGTSLDRIDNTLGYFPENCRWATAKEQSVNRRTTVMLTLGGLSMCVNDWAKEINVNRKAIMKRLKKGWPIEHVLSPEKYVRRSS
jgi:hypothetical protein